MTEPTAAEREVTGDPVTFEWLGHTVTLPATADDLDINATRAFTRGDILGFLEGVIGKRVFADIERSHRAQNDGRFTNADVVPLGDKVAEVYGFDKLGN